MPDAGDLKQHIRAGALCLPDMAFLKIAYVK
jgi:hypothetical protein